MSAEHNELIRRAYEAVNRGDAEAVKALADPAGEMETMFTSLTGGGHTGYEGVERWFKDVAESWTDIDMELNEFIEVDADRTIALVRFKARGRESGVEVNQDFAATWTIRDGKALRVETHPTLEEALAALGA